MEGEGDAGHPKDTRERSLPGLCSLLCEPSGEAFVIWEILCLRETRLEESLQNGVQELVSKDKSPNGIPKREALYKTA